MMDSHSHRPVVRSVRSRGREPEMADGACSKFDLFWGIYPHRGEFSDPKKPARAKFDRFLMQLWLVWGEPTKTEDLDLVMQCRSPD